MITDAQTYLSSAQALTATAVSTNAYDTTLAANDLFIGRQLALVVVNNVAADFTTGDESYTIQVVASASASLTSPTVLASYTYQAADRATGKLTIIPIPGGAKILRYVGVNYVLGGTTPSVTVTAFLEPWDMIDQRKYYPESVVISG